MRGPALSVDLQEMRHNMAKTRKMVEESVNARFLQAGYPSLPKNHQEMRQSRRQNLEKLDMPMSKSPSEQAIWQL